MVSSCINVVGMELQLLYEGKTKRVYSKTPELLVLEFKDDVTAMDGVVKKTMPGKGVINARLSAYLFRHLEKHGVETHLVEYNGDRFLTVRRLEMLPIEVIVRNHAYGSLLKRMPLYKKLQELNPPLVEFHYKDDSLHDPLITSEDIIYTGLLTSGELRWLIEVTMKVNNVLSELFSRVGLKLVDFKVEYGRDGNGKLILGDELTGDSIRVLDDKGNHLDKEVFRRTGDIEALRTAYIELCNRLGVDVSDVVHG
ncbi:phosphoribosylaminoimidazolesuccinocarboxamide synthase [Desulfurococcus sp.]|uniref:phosphoribosylaminoimidazolesuccinocarboxamide synthase n=2 Tax=Desulfurococcus sp. TaxID=51678 RepID=UPI00316213AF